MAQGHLEFRLKFFIVDWEVLSYCNHQRIKFEVNKGSDFKNNFVINFWDERLREFVLFIIKVKAPFFDR